MSPDTTVDIANPSWQENLLKHQMKVTYQTQLGNLEHQKTNITVWQGEANNTFAPAQLLRNPSEYRGRPQATHLVNFPAELFAGLKGRQPRNEADWTPEAMLARGIVDWSVFNPEAAQISADLTALARSGRSCDDLGYNHNYREQVQKAFTFLELGQNALEPTEKKAHEKKSIVFLRAGAPATRATIGNEAYQAGKKNGLVIPVGEKRGHLEGENKGDVTLMMELQGIPDEELQSLNGADLLICDPAFATGSSLMGFVMALESRGIRPASIELRAAAATRAGLDLMTNMLGQLDIGFKAHILKIGEYLSDQYYIGNDFDEDPKVGDAGDGLFGTQNQFDPDGDLTDCK